MNYILYIGGHVSSPNPGVSITKNACEGRLAIYIWAKKHRGIYQVNIQSGKYKSQVFQIERELKRGNYTKFLKNLEDPLGKNVSYLESRKLCRTWDVVQEGKVMFNIDEEITVVLSWRCKMGIECYPEKRTLLLSLGWKQQAHTH